MVKVDESGEKWVKVWKSEENCGKVVKNGKKWQKVAESGGK